jgi:hypothetical protein
MTKRNYSLILLAALAMFTIASCGKYEEGPGFSLSSKMGRVDNTWEIDLVKYNGVDITTNFKALYPDFQMTFKKEGSYELLLDGDRETGTWVFDSKKEKMLLTESTTKSVEVWSIMRLTQEELWTVIEDGSDKIEWRLKEK